MLGKPTKKRLDALARLMINEFMQENTHVHRCLVVEDPAGVFHARMAGAKSVRATDGKETKGRAIENPR